MLQVGSKAALKLGNKTAVWKIEDTVEAAWNGANDMETIDADQLLDEDDLKKPDKESLRGKLLYSYTQFYIHPVQFLLWKTKNHF